MKRKMNYKKFDKEFHRADKIYKEWLKLTPGQRHKNADATVSLLMFFARTLAECTMFNEPDPEEVSDENDGNQKDD